MESMRLVQQSALRQLLASRSLLSRQSTRQLSNNASRPAFRTRPMHTASFTTKSWPPRSSLPRASQQQQRPRFRLPRTFRRFQTTSAPAAEANLTLSQRMKKLSREYGWSALGVYLLLSALDFPFCFLAVKLLGTDRIGHWEHVVISYIKAAIKWPLPEAMQEQVDGVSQQIETLATENLPLDNVGDGVSGSGKKRLLEEDHAYMASKGQIGGNGTSYGEEQRLLEEGGEPYGIADHGYREAHKANSGEDASLWTQLALAYAIHKSFIFIRVPLTAAVTPKVVKTLRGWGWNIGKRPAKLAKPAADVKGSGVNTAGTGVKPDP